MGTTARPVASLLAALLLLGVGSAGAQAPEAGGRERHWYLVRASKEFEAGRFEQALVSFEAAARLAEEPLPDEALRRWGISASEAGWPRAAYVRLRQYLIAVPDAAGRDVLQARIDKARRTLLEIAPRQSRIIVLAETQPTAEAPGERQVLRLVARQGRATVEALSGTRIAVPAWQRAGDIDEAAYVTLVGKVLDSPALLQDWSAQALDPTEPGPHRSIMLRLVLGEEERARQAQRGEPYGSLQALAQMILDFPRTEQVRP